MVLQLLVYFKYIVENFHVWDACAAFAMALTVHRRARYRFAGDTERAYCWRNVFTGDSWQVKLF